MLVRGLRMLLGGTCMLLALGVVALAVSFSGGTMGLGGVFVVFGSFVMFFFGHGIPRGLLTLSRHQTRRIGKRSSKIRRRPRRGKQALAVAGCRVHPGTLLVGGCS